MAQFLEERFPSNVDYGSGFESVYETTIVTTSNGNEYRSQPHPFIKAMFDIDFERQTLDVIEQIIDLNNRANGKTRGFRVKHPIDYSTNEYRGSPTAYDMALSPVSAGVYQLVRWYGDSDDPTCARRLIRKPVSGTVLVGVAGQAYPSGQWSVDTTTGRITCAANKTRAITAITKAASAVVTVGSHTFSIGDSVAFQSVAGMTQINGLRALITATSGTTITVAINSTAFTTYTSGGSVQTQPITGEDVTGGCEFDIPCRFDADLRGIFSNWNTINASGIRILELLNP